jgi:xanthine dehydrogenase YagT iron-sulfur-binding subunit
MTKDASGSGAGKPRDAGRVSRRGFLGSLGTGAMTVAAAGAAGAEGPPQDPPVRAEELIKIALHLNGRREEVLVEARWSLSYVLRERLGLTGTKIGCERGECGACTVLIDGVPRYSSMTLAVETAGKRITTVEGLMRGEDLGPTQQAFLEEDAFQCGYCTSGQIMAVEGMLGANADPSIEDVRLGVSGNLCRCGAYAHIFKAAQRAAVLKHEAGGAS